MAILRPEYNKDLRQNNSGTTKGLQFKERDSIKRIVLGVPESSRIACTVLPFNKTIREISDVNLSNAVMYPAKDWGKAFDETRVRVENELRRVCNKLGEKGERVSHDAMFWELDVEKQIRYLGRLSIGMSATNTDYLLKRAKSYQKFPAPIDLFAEAKVG